jgi:effector-binding domain-containing protein
MGKAFAITFGALLILAGFILYRTGYFQPVELTAGKQGPFLLAYKVHKGPYHKLAPVIDEVENFFEKNGLSCPLAFGRFLHDPNTVEHDRLESHGGCAFPVKTEKLQEIIAKGDLKTDHLKKEEYVVAVFKGSPSIGPFVVYPKVEEWMAKYDYKITGPVIELYQTTGADSLTTRYLFPYL